MIEIGTAPNLERAFTAPVMLLSLGQATSWAKRLHPFLGGTARRCSGWRIRGQSVAGVPRKDDEIMQALITNGFDDAPSVRIAVPASRRDGDTVDPTAGKEQLPLLREKRIAIVPRTSPAGETLRRNRKRCGGPGASTLRQDQRECHPCGRYVSLAQ